MAKNPGNPERQALIFSAVGCLVIGGVAILFASISESKAILLDGVFNLMYSAMGLFTLKVARLLAYPHDEEFPYGYAFFEPLVNGVKGVLVLGVSVMALFDAVGALLNGGRAIAAGPAIGYGLFAATACWSLAALTKRGARRTGSPLVEADAKNWVVNAAISSAVLITFASILVIRGGPLDHLVPYVDPALVVIIGLITLSVPVRMAWSALMELLNRAPAPEVVREVRRIVTESTAALPVQKLVVRVVQPGRTRAVTAHIVLPKDYPVQSLEPFDRLRWDTLAALEARHPFVLLDMVFTADPEWGAMAPSAESKPET